MNVSEDGLPYSKEFFNCSTKTTALKVDIRSEIRAAAKRIPLVKESEIKQEVIKEEEEEKEEFSEFDDSTNEKALAAKIYQFPLGRVILHPERSLELFNAENLSLKYYFENAVDLDADSTKFFQWIELQIHSSPPHLQQSALSYLWKLLSVHPDDSILTQCQSVVLACNHFWTLKWEEVYEVLQNWGINPKEEVDIGQAAEENKSLVTFYNVECSLNVLSEQLKTGGLAGDSSLGKDIFVFLALLALDPLYACISEIQSCLSKFESINSENPSWVPEYCEALLAKEGECSRLSYLIETVLPPVVHKCLSFASVQLAFKVHPVQFVDTFKASELSDLLRKNLKSLIKWPLHEIYFILLLIHNGFSRIQCSSKKDARNDILKCLVSLNKLAKSFSADNTDANLLHELLGRLQTELEEITVINLEAFDQMEI